MTRAQRVYMSITYAVLAGLLVALAFLAPAFGPAQPADDLPDRATPSACDEPDGACLTWDDIRDLEWHTQAP